MAADPEKDVLEQFDVSPSKVGDGFSLVLTTKSEEFEIIVPRELLQELADEMYAQIDKGAADKA